MAGKITWLYGSALAVVSLGVIYWARLRSIPGATVTSWWRSPWHNAEVGGVSTSFHLIGWGWDITPGGALMQAEVAKTALPFLKVIDEGDHLHVYFSPF
jgi:hypothetical protein